MLTYSNNKQLKKIMYIFNMRIFFSAIIFTIFSYHPIKTGDISDATVELLKACTSTVQKHPCLFPLILGASTIVTHYTVKGISYVIKVGHYYWSPQEKLRVDLEKEILEGQKILLTNETMLSLYRSSLRYTKYKKQDEQFLQQFAKLCNNQQQKIEDLSRQYYADKLNLIEFEQEEGLLKSA